jgi:predicted Na+-dependent transporter
MVWMIILSTILYLYEMKCVVVPLYTCYIGVILCIFTICHTMLSHDYTHPFRHPTFCKIIQLSSHTPLTVIFAFINPCIHLGGAPCTKLENKTLLCLIVE